MEKYAGYKEELDYALRREPEYKAEVEEHLTLLLRLDSDSYEARKGCLMREPSSIGLVMCAARTPARLAHYYGYRTTLMFNRWLAKADLKYDVYKAILSEVARLTNLLDQKYDLMLLDTLGTRPHANKRKKYLKQFRSENKEIRSIRNKFRHYAVYTLGVRLGLTRMTAKQVEHQNRTNPSRYGGKDRTRKPIPDVRIDRAALELSGMNMHLLDALVELYPDVRDSQICDMLSR